MVDTTRRRLLAALGAGALSATAGCGGLAGDDPRRTPFEVPTTTSSTTTETVANGATRVPADESPLPSGARRSVTSGLDDRRLTLFGGAAAVAPPETQVAAGFLAPPSETSPARVAVAVTSLGGERRSVEFGFTPPFSAYYATRVTPGVTLPEDTGRRYLLVPAERSPYGDRTPDAPTDRGWVATAPLGTPERSVRETTVDLAPGESLRRTYVLLAHPDAAPTDHEAVRFQADWSPVSVGLGVFEASLLDRGPSRFDRSVPDLGVRTRWFHDGDGPVFLRPHGERLVPPDGVTLTLENYSLTPVSPDAWRLYRLVDGRWHRIGPWVSADDTGRDLPPGTDAPLDLVVPRHGARPPRPRRQHDDLVLGPGLYAVRYGSDTTGRVPPEAPLYVDGADRRADPDVTQTTTAEGDGGQTVDLEEVYAALFAVAGDRPPLVPTEEVERVERDGDTVTVHVEAGFGVDTGGDGRSLVVERDPSPGDRRRVLLEQVYWFPALRNALAHLDPGVRRVRVATVGRRVRRPLNRLLDGDGSRISYRGTSLVAGAGSTD